MKCPNCGKNMTDGSSFCGFCGTALLDLTDVKPDGNNKGRKKVIPFVLIAAVLLGAVTGVALFLLHGRDSVIEGETDSASATYASDGHTNSGKETEEGEEREDGKTESSDAYTDVVPQGEKSDFSIFNELTDSYFMFGSGEVDEIQTNLTIDATGNLQGISDGSALDPDAGPDEYQFFICNFTGKMADARKIDEYTYSMTLNSLETERAPGEKWTEYGSKWTSIQPHGLKEGDSFLMYLPGKPTTDLPKKLLNDISYASMYEEPMPDELDCYVLYNVTQDLGGFIPWAMDWMDDDYEDDGSIYDLFETIDSTMGQDDLIQMYGEPDHVYSDGVRYDHVWVSWLEGKANINFNSSTGKVDDVFWTYNTGDRDADYCFTEKTAIKDAFNEVFEYEGRYQDRSDLVYWTRPASGDYTGVDILLGSRTGSYTAGGPAESEIIIHAVFW